MKVCEEERKNKRLHDSQEHVWHNWQKCQVMSNFLAFFKHFAHTTTCWRGACKKGKRRFACKLILFHTHFRIFFLTLSAAASHAVSRFFVTLAIVVRHTRIHLYICAWHPLDCVNCKAYVATLSFALADCLIASNFFGAVYLLLCSGEPITETLLVNAVDSSEVT